MKYLLTFLLFCSAFSHAHVTTFGIIGDAGHSSHGPQLVQASLIKSGVKHLIMPGDNLYDEESSYDAVWSGWFAKNFEFDLVAIGNHHNGYKAEIDYFKMPAEFYAKVFGDARFIVLNSDNVENIQAQKDFLKKELEEAKEKFVFVVFHHPPFTLRHSWREKKDFQNSIRPLLFTYNKRITAILSGHDHIATLVDMNSIPVVISGAAFESFIIPAINYSENGLKMMTQWTSVGGFFWTRLDINSQTNEVWINFVRSDREEVSCSVRIHPRPLFKRDNCSRRQ